MTDALDIDLHDPDLGAEIALVAALMVAAAEASGPLSQREIDDLLGATPPPPPAQSAGQATERIRVTSTEPSTHTAADAE